MTTRDPAQLYEQDLYTWGRRQAAALRRAARERVNTSEPIDWLNVAEEIDAMAGSQAREPWSRYRVLLIHLLKWCYQPGRRSRSWQSTIVEQRAELERLVGQSPGLKRLRRARFADAYGAARRQASVQTGLPIETFPETAPFALEDASSDEFRPEPITAGHAPTPNVGTDE